VVRRSRIGYLKSVDNQSGLESILKISETEYDFFSRLFFSGDQADRLEAREGTEDIYIS
jgi:hypothetical protein